jgi:hypothetical protein
VAGGGGGGWGFVGLVILAILSKNTKISLINPRKKPKKILKIFNEKQKTKIIWKKISPIWTQTGAGGRNEKWREMDSSWL